MKARWYKAMGGEGLEIQREPDGDWTIFGIVQANHGCWDAMLNRQEESFSLGLFPNKNVAMAYLLKRSGANLED